MLGRWFKKKVFPPLLGIDIGGQRVSVVELSSCGGQYRLERYAMASLAVEHEVADQSQQLIQTVMDVYQQSGAKQTAVAAALASADVLTQSITIPAGLSRDAMETQLAAEIEPLIPYPLDEIVTDFAILGHCPDQPHQVRVLLAACRRQALEQRLWMLESAQLAPRVVDAEVYAIERAMRLVEAPLMSQSNNLVAVVHIDDRLSLVHGGKVSLNLLEAGRTVYRYDQGLAEKAVAASSTDDWLHTWVAPSVAQWLQEGLLASDYAMADCVVLIGAGATSSMAEALQTLLATTTIVANPFQIMSLAPTIDATALYRDAPALMVACGLAMHGLGNGSAACFP